MIKSLQPQEDIRTGLGRKKSIILTGLRKKVTACHTGSRGKHQGGKEA